MFGVAYGDARMPNWLQRNRTPLPGIATSGQRRDREGTPGQLMLTVFWDSRSLVYAEFGPDACKEKRNVTQETYFIF